tara:strand:- start:2139 stop:3002 length:864 start_codon:yes stop_codon:yes gene_type:complete
MDLGRDVKKASEVVTSKLSSVVESTAGTNLGVIVSFSILLFVSVYVVFYVYRKYNSTSLKTVTMLQKPKKISSIQNISNTVRLPTYVNGNEFSYSFWMYVDSTNAQSTKEDKFIIGSMGAKGALSTANPVFFMDNNTNKLHVYVDTGGHVNTLGDMKLSPDSLTIAYMPLQRWVNVLLVVDNNFVQLFMDGELRQVKDIAGSKLNKVVAQPAGNLYIGGVPEQPAVSGFLSKVQVFNYAVTIDHAKIIYKAGPLNKSFLSVIGAGTYGVQSPFYKIEDKMDSCDKTA